MSDQPAGELKEQLSCLADSELDDVQARFLFRRLAHDEELRGCWERYHLVRSTLQDRQFSRAAGLSGRVSAAIASETMEQPAMADRMRGWLQPVAGAAVAAVVAVVAFNLWQQPATDSGGTAPLTLVNQPTADLMGEVNPLSSQIAVPAVATSTRGGANATLQQYMIRHSQATSSVNGLHFVYVVSETMTETEAEEEGDSTDGNGQIAR